MIGRHVDLVAQFAGETDSEAPRRDAGDFGFAHPHEREGCGVEREARRQRAQHLARPRSDQGRVCQFLGERGEEHLELGPFGLQPFFEPVHDRAGIAGRRRHKKPIGREAGPDAVVEYHAVLAAHQPVAAPPDRQVLPMVDVDAVEKPPGIAAEHLDLAEGRGVEEGDPVAHREAFAPDRRNHVLTGERVIARALPLSDILEHRAGDDMPIVHRGDPHRVTPMHDWHVVAGAVFEDVGQWKRPRYYPLAGEDMIAAVRRECLAVRDRVALFDASTLGKIEVFGRDAGRFLDRIYINHWQNLAIGRCRYGLMCREDGMVFDDGVGTRLAPDRFFLTTTTGNAGAVLDWLEEWLQTEWPELEVFCTSLTEEWANATLVGPRAREVLSALAPRLPLDRASFPFMRMREAEIAGIPARIFRVSFSGELSYEITVPADHGLSLWERLIAAGMPYGITPYGTEAMHVLRAEKGYLIVGQETDGSVTPIDLGLGALAANDKDFLGRRSLARSDTARADRKQLVGLLPDNPQEILPEGAQLVAELGGAPPVAMIGHVTSSYFGARIGRSFALALVESGRSRHGAPVWAPLPDRIIAARICPPVFYDPDNRRRDG